MPGWHLSFHFHSIQTRLVLCKTWSLVTYFLAITATIPHPTAACVTKTIHHRHLQCIKTKAYFIVSLFHFNPKVYWTSTMSKAPHHARSCGKYTYRKVKSLHWVMCSIVGEIKKCPRKSTQFKEIQQVPYIQIFKSKMWMCIWFRKGIRIRNAKVKHAWSCSCPHLLRLTSSALLSPTSPIVSCPCMPAVAWHYSSFQGKIKNALFFVFVF